MRKKEIKHTVIILPKDFKNTKFMDNFNCPLARAMKRHFKTKDVSVGTSSADIGWKFLNGALRSFVIEDMFTEEDYDFAKTIKEPYPVVLIEV